MYRVLYWSIGIVDIQAKKVEVTSGERHDIINLFSSDTSDVYLHELYITLTSMVKRVFNIFGIRIHKCLDVITIHSKCVW